MHRVLPTDRVGILVAAHEEAVSWDVDHIPGEAGREGIGEQGFGHGGFIRHFLKLWAC